MTADQGPVCVCGHETGWMWSPEWVSVANTVHWVSCPLGHWSFGHWSQHVDPVSTGLLSLSTLDVWDQIFLYCRGPSCALHNVYQHPGLHLLDAGTYPHPCDDNQKCLQTWPRVSEGMWGHSHLPVRSIRLRCRDAVLPAVLSWAHVHDWPAHPNTRYNCPRKASLHGCSQLQSSCHSSPQPDSWISASNPGSETYVWPPLQELLDLPLSSFF